MRTARCTSQFFLAAVANFACKRQNFMDIPKCFEICIYQVDLGYMYDSITSFSREGELV